MFVVLKISLKLLYHLVEFIVFTFQFGIFFGFRFIQAFYLLRVGLLANSWLYKTFKLEGKLNTLFLNFFFFNDLLNQYFPQLFGQILKLLIIIQFIFLKYNPEFFVPLILSFFFGITSLKTPFKLFIQYFYFVFLRSDYLF